MARSESTTGEWEDYASSIRVIGARTNNLKNISVNIPRNQLVVLTGRSGSGKSSLAFNTIFAEGQRQYIESLSVFARQFFTQIQRADVDLIEGLQPTLSLDQRHSGSNPRSTVSTVTEVHDYLRLLLARAGEIHCYQCNAPIQQQSCQQIRDWILGLPSESKVMILAPLVSGQRGRQEDVIARIRKERLVRLRINGEVHDIDRLPELNPRRNNNIDAVTDRIIIRDGIETRLLEAIELAVRLSNGLVCAVYKLPAGDHPAQIPQDDWQERLFSTLYACAKCNLSYAEIQPRTFSFNSPYGACPNCEGLGQYVQFDPDLMVPNRSLSISGGAIRAWQGLNSRARKKWLTQLQPILQELEIDPEQPLDRVPPDRWEQFLGAAEQTRAGLIVLLEKELATATDLGRREQLEALQDVIACPDCAGSRLGKEANSVFLGGKNISAILQMSVAEAVDFFQSLEFTDERREVAASLLPDIVNRLKFLLKVGVHYLTLGRGANSLSGGEFQRVRLATSIGSGLTSVCYVLDEPSIGLHQRDNDRLIEAIRELQQAGNSVLVVEHDESMIRAADHVVDIGPGAGSGGGEIVAAGTVQDIADVDRSLTGSYLSGKRNIATPAQRRPGHTDKFIRIRGASGHNLRSVDMEIPLGTLTCVTGVSGSGKSTLVYHTLAPAIAFELGLIAPRPQPFEELTGLEHIDRLTQINQAPIGKTSRGCTATYTGLMDELRKVFAATRAAKQLGFGPSRFSFNSKSGWCPDCQGHGQKKITMTFLEDMYVECETCQGRRYSSQTLQVRYAGLTIADVLALSVEEALARFDSFARMQAILSSLTDVGLGYLKLGQASNTFSGGEAQRIKLATELCSQAVGNGLYLLDEPTTGLHFDDIRSLLSVLNQLVEAGNTVIVIEHNLDIIKSADWIIDLGPEGGKNGGQVIATGTPEQVASVTGSSTGQYLAAVL